MKDIHLLETNEGTLKALSFIKESPSRIFLQDQSFWQDKRTMFLYHSGIENPFYKFLHQDQYNAPHRKLLTIANIYAHILFKKDLI